MHPPYSYGFLALCAVQALAVVAPRTAPRLPFLHRHAVLGLLPLLGIGGGVLLIGNVPSAAARLTDLAAFATPLLALGGLAAHRVRPFAIAAAPLYLVAWKEPRTRSAEIATDLLIVGACATLAWLTGAVAPRWAIALGIVVATVVDVVQVANRDVQPVAQALAGASPPSDLPSLQQAVWNGASMGWGDVYLAALLGVVVAALPARRVALAAVTTLVAGLAWGYMFRVWDLIPATVPVAVGLVVVAALELARPSGRPGPWPERASSRDAAAGPG